jgi:hypothetical protein
MDERPEPGRRGRSDEPQLVTTTCQTAGGPLITIVTGPRGRLESASCKIEKKHLGKGTETTDAARDFARRMGRDDDDAGHAIGCNLGGPGGATSGNIFPFDSTVNRGAFSQFEQKIAEEVRKGKDVSVEVECKYNGRGTRPTEVVYNVTVDGKTTTRTFQNP